MFRITIMWRCTPAASRPYVPTPCFTAGGHPQLHLPTIRRAAFPKAIHGYGPKAAAFASCRIVPPHFSDIIDRGTYMELSSFLLLSRSTVMTRCYDMGAGGPQVTYKTDSPVRSKQVRKCHHGGACDRRERNHSLFSLAARAFSTGKEEF